MGTGSNGIQHDHGRPSADSQNCSIFKVPTYLRRIKEEAYEPQVLCIGPYSRSGRPARPGDPDKDHDDFKAMEEHKLRYQVLLLGRKEESVGRHVTAQTVQGYVTALKNIKPKPCSFYSEPLDHFKGDSFEEMMVLDGCFIIELIQKKARKEDDHLLTNFNVRTVMRDLLLLENQLPFPVLLELFQMTLMPNDEAKDFTKMAISFFSEVMPGPQIANPENIAQDIQHLLGLIYDNLCGSNASKRPQRNANCVQSLLGLIYDRLGSNASRRPQRDAISSVPEVSIQLLNSADGPSTMRSGGGVCYALNRVQSLICGGVCCALNRVQSLISACLKKKPKQDGWQLIGSATKLYKAGIKFQVREKKSLLDIEFRRGVMRIPTLKINDETESILRNLIAYEQCYRGISSKSKRLADYITFMDCLINTGKDVELLCHSRVIDNWLGDHDAVAALFNKFRSSVLISQENFSYSQLFNNVNNHCQSRINIWIAILLHNYLDSPWAWISFFAALVLLVLSGLQTYYTMRPYL